MIRVAVTAGDTNGIGPEVAMKGLAGYGDSPVCFELIGDAGAIQAQARECACEPPAAGNGPEARVTLRDPAPDLAISYRPGIIDPLVSRKAAAAIRMAVEGCLEGRYDAMVTAPISKEGFAAAGINYPGHTEMLAELTGRRRFAMLLMGGGLRVVLVTRHLPLKKVPHSLSTESILEAITLLAEGLPWLDCPSGRIGVLGLNPHAGDGGALGREEIEIIAPAVEQAGNRGYRVFGPLPPDVAFYQARRGRYDALVAMYHDQGLGPLKMLAFDSGVNITLGLPLCRTSPDHGTAFDIAGKNRAEPDSMGEALQAAGKLAKRPNPWIEPRTR